MIPLSQFTGHGSSSPGAPAVLLAPPGDNPVSPQTSATSALCGILSGTPVKPHMSIRTKQFLPAAEPPRTDFPWIVDLPPLLKISYKKYDADSENHD